MKGYKYISNNPYITYTLTFLITLLISVLFINSIQLSENRNEILRLNEKIKTLEVSLSNLIVLDENNIKNKLENYLYDAKIKTTDTSVSSENLVDLSRLEVEGVDNPFLILINK